MTTQQKKEYFTSPHGTKYMILGEGSHVSVEANFIIDLKRLLLFEEFCDVTGHFLPCVITEAIWEKMDDLIRNADTEQIGKYIKGQYLEKWDYSRRNKVDLQSPVDDGKWL